MDCKHLPTKVDLLQVSQKLVSFHYSINEDGLGALQHQVHLLEASRRCHHVVSRLFQEVSMVCKWESRSQISIGRIVVICANDWSGKKRKGDSIISNQS